MSNKVFFTLKLMTFSYSRIKKPQCFLNFTNEGATETAAANNKKMSKEFTLFMNFYITEKKKKVAINQIERNDIFIIVQRGEVLANFLTIYFQRESNKKIPIIGTTILEFFLPLHKSFCM